MRWKAVIAMFFFALTVTVGCEHSCFVSECDLDHYRELGLPPNAEGDVASDVIPSGVNVPTPATIDFPERKPRPLTLAEAIAIALENGTTGSPGLNGTTADELATLQGRAVVAAENPIRVLALEPAIAATDIDTSLSKFDARYTGSMVWQQTDQPDGGNIVQDLSNGQGANFSQGILKPLPTGGVTGITFSTQYLDLFNPPTGVVNPQYRPKLQFQFEQPLLQGFGTDINEIRAQHPGSFLTPFNTNTGVDGILITRTHFDQSRAEFERQVHVLVTNVEVAYWNLYGAYFALFSREQVLSLALETYLFTQARATRSVVSSVDLAQARAQYETFRGQRLEALSGVLAAEHQLRGLLGLPVEDGTRLVPLDTPTLAPFQPDWYTSLSTALSTRPELVLARQDLKQRQFAVMNQKNLLLPDLRFFATYDINSLGTNLDEGGSSNPNNALANLARNEAHDWEVGFHMDYVFGRRAELAGLRATRLRLAQGYYTLKDQEKRATAFLATQYQLLDSSYKTIQNQRAQRLAYGQALQGRLTTFARGTEESQATTALSFLLDAQRFYADALRAESSAIVEYNNAMARFEFARGTILQHDNVFIGEGPLPRCAQERAVEHERRRKLAIELRERQCYHYAPTDTVPRFGMIQGDPQQPSSGLGLLMGDFQDEGATAPPVPPMLKGDPPPSDALDKLPPPQEWSGAGTTSTPTANAPMGMIIEPAPSAVQPGMILDQK